MNDETGISHADTLNEDYFSDETRWQSWLDVEAALALSQSEIGMIPEDAGPASSASRPSGIGFRCSLHKGPLSALHHSTMLPC